jgi:transposase
MQYSGQGRVVVAGSKLIQAPLPWLPGGAAEIAPGVGLLDLPGGGGQMWVHGMATFTWDAGDEAGRRLAAVQVTQLKAATQKQVAAALGTDQVTVWRWVSAFREKGLAGLLPARKGPRGPTKLTAELTAKIKDLDARGLGLEAIASQCGVSTFAVRTALGRIPARPRPAAPEGNQPAAGGAAGQDAEDTAAQETEDTAAGTADHGTAGDTGHRAAEQDAAAEGAAGDCAGRGDAPGGGLLPVLPDPVPRGSERALARFGLLGEGAAPVFVPGARYPLAGLLLALPALADTGLLACARRVYGRLRDGYYSLDAVLVHLVLQALLREPRAEGATRVPPPAMGRILGLDRAPEVKTIRRKLAELAAAGKAADLQMAIARHHAQAVPDQLGFLYIDGHTRAYFGERDIQKMHVARLKFPGPATEETWVTDGAGDPLLVVMAEPSASLAAQIKDLLPSLRQIAGEDRKPVLCFDRGGWSPDLFAEITDAGFDLLTYRKASAGEDIPDLPADAFTTAAHPGDDGREHRYELADGTADITITKGARKGRVLTLRQVTRLDKGRQVRILTSRQAGNLPAAAVIYKMGSRWREENYFRYGRQHFALDALDSYAVTPEDPDRKVPSPAKKKAAAAVKTARNDLAAAQAARDARLTALRTPAPGQETLITNQQLARLDAPVTAARQRLQDTKAAARAIPAKIPLSQHNPDLVRLDTETKLITHAIRMAAYNTETILARALNGTYARADDEAYALIREALTTSGDIIPADATLTIRLDPLSAPRRTRALAALCEQLTATGARYPGTGLTLRYEVKEHTA